MPVPGNGGMVAVSRRLLVDDVYDRILNAIYSGQLAPGEKLNDSELCAWLGTSRTPIRQALARLETQGLVETAANRWTRVTPINALRYRKSIPVVSSLYRIAAEDAVTNMSAGDVQALTEAGRPMLDALQTKEHEELIATTLKVSDLVVRFAENPVLTEALQTVMPRIRRINAIYTKELPRSIVVEAFPAAVTVLGTGDREAAGQVWYDFFHNIGKAVADLLDADAAAGRFDVP